MEATNTTRTIENDPAIKGFFVRPTITTPSVYFNPKKGLLDLRGKSNPENPLTFYEYLLKSIDSYQHTPAEELAINMAYEYFNTSSSKCIYTLLKKINSLQASGKQVTLNWYYEEGDEDMREAGEDLSQFFTFAFNFIEIPVINFLQSGKIAA